MLFLCASAEEVPPPPPGGASPRQSQGYGPHSEELVPGVFPRNDTVPVIRNAE